MDSSVIIKWFTEEENTLDAIQLRQMHIEGNAEIAAPDLLLYEIGNALRYNKKLNENDIISAVDSLIEIEIDIVVPTKEVMDNAVSFSLKYDITVYDAYFLSLAYLLKFTLITADEKFHNKVKELGFIELLKELNL